MFIEKLQMHNFKKFEDLEVYFHPKLTVLVGANGSGKSTVIDGVAIALSAIFSKIDGVNGINMNKSHAHLKSYSAGSIEDVQPQYPVEISATAQISSDNISWTRSLNAPDGRTTIGRAKDMINLGMDFQKRVRKGDTELILPLLVYYGTGRLWDYHRLRQSDTFQTNNRFDGYQGCMDGTASIKQMMDWFAKMTIRQYQNRELGIEDMPELKAVYGAMENCFRRIMGHDEVKIQYNLGTGELEVAYREKNKKWMRIPISLLSDGYKSTISLVADIAYRMAVLNPQLLDAACTETEGIVLIDEVDLHLHPAWQQRILGDLMDIFPKVQFIVTTHAPTVISAAKSENIILLENNEAYLPSEQVFGRDANTIIRSVMGASERIPQARALFQKFYQYVDEQDVDGAEGTFKELVRLLGENDYEISSCHVKLMLLKARKER